MRLGKFGNGLEVPIHVTSADKVPKVEHYAIFTYSTRNTSTYETNDGSVAVIKYEAYLDKTAWLAEIEELEKDRGHGKEPYTACVIKPMQVSVKVSVDVSGA